LSKRKRATARAIQTRNAPENSALALWLRDEDICMPGYTRLCDIPEIQTACLRIAELIGSMTIYLMSNTKQGDVRIQNELSKKIDITPCDNMTRSEWMTAIVMNLLLYGAGNSVVVPHTHKGILQSLEPIAADRVQFMPVYGSRRDYRILIDGVARKPEDVLHFTYNPDREFLWKGQGLTVTLRDIAQNLKQAQKTVNAFLSSEFKPSVIVKVAALAPEFASPEGRKKLIDSYVRPESPGQPWIIPAGDFAVEQVKPLTLADLAIRDTIELDRRAVASVVGVPPYLAGVGEFKRDEWNNFVQTKIRAIALGIQQELTRGLILSPDWYLRFNFWSLLDYDLKSISDILQSGGDRGWVNGDEWRDRMYLPPAGLKEYRPLENYIPYEKSGDQKKLVQE
jgi:HK97 family phage portal protein